MIFGWFTDVIPISTIHNIYGYRFSELVLGGSYLYLAKKRIGPGIKIVDEFLQFLL